MITYNYLNLPTQVVKNTNEKIVYTYDAGGRKLRQQVYNATGALTKTTDYDGEYIYQNDTLKFLNHEEGRVIMNVPPGGAASTAPEYQYHLKDHLGNVRVTFTTQTTVKTFTAGFEVTDQTTEASTFNNYPTGGKLNTVATNAHTGTNSYYLNGGYSGQVGVAKSLSVMPGDQVSIQAYAKYNSPSSTATDFTPFLASLLSAFNLAAPAAGEVGTPAAGIKDFAGWEFGLLGDENKSDAIKAFVTIVMFDRNYKFLDVAYQAVQSDGSLNATYTAKQPGYAYLYISNEHPTQMDVYFDDVTIIFTPSPVVQQEDFYPFGLTFNSYTRENAVPQNYLYSGKELQSDLSLNWLDYGARMYMSDIGRWGVNDPLADKYFNISPYTYVANDPIKLFDPDGKRIYFVNESGELKRATRTMLKTYSGVQIYSRYMRSKTDDVYIGSANFGTNAEAAGITATVSKTDGFFMNNSRLSLSVKSQMEKNAFGIFGSTDFSKSKGKNVHLVSISNEALKDNDKYTSAEIMYHELKAHVEIGTGDDAEDHKRYGNFRAGLGIEQPVYDLNKNPVTGADGNQILMPKGDSPAGQMTQQLLILKQNEQNVNEYLEKKNKEKNK